MADDYERALKNAREAANIGDIDLEIAWMQKAKALASPFKGHDFGPDDSLILSSVAHPVEAAKRLKNFVIKESNIASGDSDPYDNPTPWLGSTPEQQVGAGLTLATMMQTGAMPLGPKMTGGALGTVLNPFNAKKQAAKKIGEIVGMPEDNANPIVLNRRPGTDFVNIPGIQPTAGMLYDDPRILSLEARSRLAPFSHEPKKSFFLRDNQNLDALYNANAERALDPAAAQQKLAELNAKTTPMREAAFDEARNGPVLRFAGPLKMTLEDLLTNPESWNDPGLRVVAKDAQSWLKPPEGVSLEPEGLYNFRKTGINDRLASTANDTEANTVKNSRRYLMQLKNSVDEGLNNASGGQFGNYLEAHANGMKPINEGQAIQSVIDRFLSAPRVFNSENPAMTPAAYRRALANDTYQPMGNDIADLLSPETRTLTKNTADALDAIQKARTGPKQTLGSDTAPWAVSLLRRGLLPKIAGGKASVIVDLLDALGQSVGARELDDALLNPTSGKLEELLKLYGDRGMPVYEQNQTLSNLLKRSTYPSVSMGAQNNKGNRR